MRCKNERLLSKVLILISQRELENFCHGLKGNLEEQYVSFWKDQIQQQ